MIICRSLFVIIIVSFYRTPTASYKFVLALAFSIDEVNRNSNLLPNVSLVFELPAGGCHPVSQLHSLIHNSEQSQEAPPNYVCYEDIGCAVLLTGPYWATSVIMWKIMDLYQSQQVSIFWWVCKKCHIC